MINNLYLPHTDTITILSPTVCVILCELNLADDIYNTIAQNNRSLPWMKVCLRACSILITLTKYSYTRKYVLKVRKADSLSFFCHYIEYIISKKYFVLIVRKSMHWH